MWQGMLRRADSVERDVRRTATSEAKRRGASDRHGPAGAR